MQNIEENPKKRFNFETYGTVVSFLCLEILAFLSFNLGHSFMLYGILSIVLVICLGLVTFRQINKDGITSYVFFLFPLFVYGLLTALSVFNTYSLGAIGIANSVFVPIALSFFALAGFLSFYTKGFKIRLALIVIYSSLALFVLINLIVTMIYYVPFYTLIYRKYYAYYLGSPSSVPIGSMAYMLFGFKISEVSLEYWSLFPSILLSAAVPLFFLKYKENKREFLIYVACTAIAGLSLLITISKITLLSDFALICLLAMIICTGRFIKCRSFLNGFIIGIGAVFGIVILIMFLNAQTSWGQLAGFRKAISSSSLLSRLFNTNRFAQLINTELRDLFMVTKDSAGNLIIFKLFGVPVYLDMINYPNFETQVLSGIWIFDNLITSGLFGAIFFLVAIVVGIRRLFLYIAKSSDYDADKYPITGFVFTVLFISLILYDNSPLIYFDRLVPIYTSTPLLVSVFLLSYAFNSSLNTSKVKEEKEANEHETIAL